MMERRVPTVTKALRQGQAGEIHPLLVEVHVVAVGAGDPHDLRKRFNHLTPLLGFRQSGRQPVDLCDDSSIKRRTPVRGRCRARELLDAAETMSERNRTTVRRTELDHVVATLRRVAID